MAVDAPTRILVVGARGIGGTEGGVEKFAEEFVARARSVASVSVLCLQTAPGVPDDVEQIVVPRSRLLKTDKANYLVACIRLHLTRRFDRIFILGMNFAILVVPLRLLFWRPTQIYVRSGSVDYTLAKWGKAMRLVMRIAEQSMRLADGVIAVSHSIKRHLESVGIASVLVRNGLDRSFPQPPLDAREPNTILAVGRVTHQKNYGLLVDASRLLGPGGPEVMIIGGADLSDEHDALTAKIADGQGRIVLAGMLPRPRVLGMLASKALYVNCSLHEGMSNAVLEAVQLGIPVILSDIEANRDLDLPEHHYFKLDTATGLAEKIKDAITNPSTYVVARERFDDWTTAVTATLHVMNLMKPLNNKQAIG